jgi:SAM-dependent methyltransferase
LLTSPELAYVPCGTTFCGAKHMTNVYVIPITLAGSVPLVCPMCRGCLRVGEAEWACDSCGTRFPLRDGAPDLIVGERYEVTCDESVLVSEEITNRRTVVDFYSPLFRELFGARKPRILSLGCGVGADVDALCDAGFDAYGIDNGIRSSVWKRRKYPERLVMANGKHMPFPSESFDCVFCGCVFPHVGVKGASYEVTPDYREQRLELATEMARILKPGGRAVVSNPNRWFPFDIFHEHTADHFRARATPPWNPLLLSRGDYQALFAQAGCVRASGLSNLRYWSFANSRKSLKGRIASIPVQALFWTASTIKPLRTSFINPWIIVMIEKAGAAQ